MAGDRGWEVPIGQSRENFSFGFGLPVVVVPLFLWDSGRRSSQMKTDPRSFRALRVAASLSAGRDNRARIIRRRRSRGSPTRWTWSRGTSYRFSCSFRKACTLMDCSPVSPCVSSNPSVRRLLLLLPSSRPSAPPCRSSAGVRRPPMSRRHTRGSRSPRSASTSSISR